MWPDRLTLTIWSLPVVVVAVRSVPVVAAAVAVTARRQRWRLVRHRPSRSVLAGLVVPVSVCPARTVRCHRLVLLQPLSVVAVVRSVTQTTEHPVWLVLLAVVLAAAAVSTRTCRAVPGLQAVTAADRSTQ